MLRKLIRRTEVKWMDVEAGARELGVHLKLHDYGVEELSPRLQAGEEVIVTIRRSWRSRIRRVLQKLETAI